MRDKKEREIDFRVLWALSSYKGRATEVGLTGCHSQDWVQRTGSSHLCRPRGQLQPALSATGHAVCQVTLPLAGFPSSDNRSSLKEVPSEPQQGLGKDSSLAHFPQPRSRAAFTFTVSLSLPKNPLCSSSQPLLTFAQNNVLVRTIQ